MASAGARRYVSGMVERSVPTEVTVWVDGRSAPLVGDVLALMGSAVHVLSVGGTREQEVDRLARDLNCPRQDDIRKLLVDHPAAYLVLGSMAGLSAEDSAAALGQGTTILALDPVAASHQELATITNRRGKGEAGATTARALHAPLFTQSPGYLSAAEPWDVVGEMRLVNVQNIGDSASASIYARLFDAWLAVLAVVDMPQSIDASLMGQPGGVPDDLRSLTGRIAAHARMADGSAALVSVAEVFSESRREMLVFGRNGQLQVTDTGYELRQKDGVVDASAGGGHLSHADLVAAQWKRLLERGPGSFASTGTPERDAQALACCQACLLSARTGQPENPRKLLEMRS